MYPGSPPHFVLPGSSLAIKSGIITRGICERSSLPDCTPHNFFFLFLLFTLVYIKRNSAEIPFVIRVSLNRYIEYVNLPTRLPRFRADTLADILPYEICSPRLDDAKQNAGSRDPDLTTMTSFPFIIWWFPSRPHNATLEKETNEG